MTFKEQVLDFWQRNGVTVVRTEQEGDNSIVCHVPKDDNIKVANLRDIIEPTLNCVMVQSDSFGMNVVVVELDEDE